MNSRGKHMLSLVLGNKFDGKEANSLPKFKEILGERTLNEEEDLQVS